jgi:hypothetical protein
MRRRSSLRSQAGQHLRAAVCLVCNCIRHAKVKACPQLVSAACRMLQHVACKNFCKYNVSCKRNEEKKLQIPGK